MNENPDTVIKRLALTGIEAALRFDVEAHPTLREPTNRYAFDLYDAQLTRVGWVLNRTREMEKSSDYSVNFVELHTRLAAQVQALSGILRVYKKLPQYPLTVLPAYLRSSAYQVENILDKIEASVYAPHEPVEVRIAAELRDVLNEILEAARKSRKTFSSQFRIPQAFRDKLRHDQATEALRAIIPPFSSGQKRDFRRSFYEQGFGEDEKDLPSAADFQSVYEKSMKTWQQNLKGGVMVGGSTGAIDLKTKPEGLMRSNTSVSLDSGATREYKWELVVNVYPDHMQLLYRWSLTSIGIQKVLFKWIRGAEQAMMEAESDPKMATEYRVEEAQQALNRSREQLHRASGGRADISTRITYAEENSLLLTLEITRTSEKTLPSDRRDRQRQLLELHALNRAMLGTRSHTEKMARETASHEGWEFGGVREVRSRTNDLNAYGFEVTWKIPATHFAGNASSGSRFTVTRMISALTDFCGSIGRGVKGMDPEDAKLVEDFEKKYGPSSGLNQASREIRIQSDKLQRRIQDMLVDNNLSLSNNARVQLERIKKGLMRSRFRKLDMLEIGIPAVLDNVEERYKRKANATAINSIDPIKLKSLLNRAIGNFSSKIAPAIRIAGVSQERLPQRSSVISALVSQSEHDLQRFARSSDYMCVRIPHGDNIGFQRIACIDDAGVGITIENVGQHVVVHAHLSEMAMLNVAAC